MNHLTSNNLGLICLAGSIAFLIGLLSASGIGLDILLIAILLIAIAFLVIYNFMLTRKSTMQQESMNEHLRL